MVICLVVCVGAEMGVYYVSVYGLLFEIIYLKPTFAGGCEWD
jgi:hypothetical protein